MDGVSTDRPDLESLFTRIQEGWSRRQYDDRRYGVTRTVSAGGRIQKIFAEELGGPDVISANLYLGNRFRPCEMPAEKVLDFLARSTALPVGPEHRSGPEPVALQH